METRRSDDQRARLLAGSQLRAGRPGEGETGPETCHDDHGPLYQTLHPYAQLRRSGILGAGPHPDETAGEVPPFLRQDARGADGRLHREEEPHEGRRRGQGMPLFLLGRPSGNDARQRDRREGLQPSDLCPGFRGIHDDERQAHGQASGDRDVLQPHDAAAARGHHGNDPAGRRRRRHARHPGRESHRNGKPVRFGRAHFPLAEQV